jgi:hypothetical protein
MKILTQVNARVLWYVPTEDINPSGLDLIPVYASLQSRYKFKVYPTKFEDLHPTTGGIVFARGSFGLGDGQAVEIVRFEIFGDGLMLDTRHSTGMSEQILGDILAFVSQSHRLTFEPAMVRKKAYVSEVVATTPQSLVFLSPKFQTFCSLLTETCGEGFDFQPDQIRFGTDSERTPIPIRFRFERREGVAFRDNRYFSLAPTTTDKHQQILDALEALLVE